MLFGSTAVSLPKPSSDHVPLKTEITFPNLLANVLLVYRLTPRFASHSCKGKSESSPPTSIHETLTTTIDSLLPPLLVQTTSVESHYHRIHPSTSFPYRKILLHSHSPAPYIFTPSSGKGLNLTLHTSGEPGACYPESISITVDWWTSVGRWGYRYWPVLVTWSIGIASLVIWTGLRVVVNGNGEKPWRLVPGHTLTQYNTPYPRSSPSNAG